MKPKKTSPRVLLSVGLIVIGIALLGVSSLSLIIVEPVGWVRSYTASNGAVFEIWQGYNNNGILKYYVLGHPDVEYTADYNGIVVAQQACENWVRGTDPGGGGSTGVVFKVRDTSTGNPVAGATVTYADVGSTTTNSLGEASFTGIPTDSKTWRITRSGYIDQTGASRGVKGSTISVVVNLSLIGYTPPSGRILTVQPCSPAGRGEVSLSPLPSGKSQPGSGGGAYGFVSGTRVAISATATTGYTFDSFTVQTSSGATPNYYTTNPMTLTMAEDMIIYALFKGSSTTNTQHLLSVEAPYPTGEGTVQLIPSPVSGPQPGSGAASCYYTSGTKISATATPTSSGYVFDYWIVTTAGVSSRVTVNLLSISMNADTELRAFFKLGSSTQTSFAIVVDQPIGGIVSLSGGSQIGDVYIFSPGATTSVTFTPLEGYKLDHSVLTPSRGSPISITQKNYTFLVNDDFTLNAVFTSTTIPPTPTSSKNLILLAGAALILIGIMGLLSGGKRR